MNQIVYGIVGKLLTYVKSNELVNVICSMLAFVKMEEFYFIK